MRYLKILPFFLLLSCGVLFGDTIYMKEGQEFKGVVVEDYHDRVILSTEKGEISLFKKDVVRIGYDVPEENLVRLGGLYRDKGDYQRALYCYETAYKLNPSMKEAQDGARLLTNMAFNKIEADLKKQVSLKQDIEENIGEAAAETVGPNADAKKNELLERVGIVIEAAGPDIKVVKVLKNSTADNAGAKEQDEIVSIWGKDVKYMPISEVYGLFLRSNVNECRLVVSRHAYLGLKKGRLFGGVKDIIGGELGMEFEGLTVGKVFPWGPLEKAGILEGDTVAKVGDAPTRYLPLSSVYRLIKEKQGKSINLQIQRELVFWKKKEP